MRSGHVLVRRPGAVGVITSDGTVITDAITSIETIAGRCTRLIAVMTILDGCTDDREDQRDARRPARQDLEARFRALLSEAARLATLQPDIGRALTARDAPACAPTPTTTAGCTSWNPASGALTRRSHTARESPEVLPPASRALGFM